MIPRSKKRRPQRGEDRWYVVQTKSQQERRLATELHAKKVSYFLPMQDIRVKRGSNRLVDGMRLLFPGYLFFYGDYRDLYALKDCQRHVQIIEVNDQIRLERELESIRVASSTLTFDSWKGLVKGARVRFASGPMRGTEGVVQGTELKAGDVVVQLTVSILGCASFTVEASQLEVLQHGEKETTREGAA